MWKSMSWRFWKCCSFWVLKVLNQSYWLSKFGENWRKKSMERRRCKKKTRPQYCVLSSETNSTAFSHGGDDMLFVSELKTQNCGRVFFFWRLVFSMTDQFFRTRPSLTANNSRSKAPTPNKFYIFGNVRTWGFTWTYPGNFFLWANFEEWAFYEKSRFLAFFRVRTEKNFKQFWIGQYWSLTPCT